MKRPSKLSSFVPLKEYFIWSWILHMLPNMRNDQLHLFIKHTVMFNANRIDNEQSNFTQYGTKNHDGQMDCLTSTFQSDNKIITS